jgi:hypothetical protein
MIRFLGVALIVLALGIGITPQFTDCLSQGQVSTLTNGTTQPMKCHWTAQGEIAVAVPLAGVGIFMAASRRKMMLITLGVVGVLMGAMAIALPNGLIGTCAVQTHLCNTAMKPILDITGSLTIIGSLAAMVIARKVKE